MSNEEDKTPETESGEHMIHCDVVDRSGHTTTDLCVPDAVALARKEMGKKKWLYTVDHNGKSDVIMDVKKIADDSVAYGIFENVSELRMMGAVQGG